LKKKETPTRFGVRGEKSALPAEVSGRPNCREKCKCKVDGVFPTGYKKEVR